jgi:hypothetical protein
MQAKKECLSMFIFWVVTPCGLIGRYERFGGTYCLHLQGGNVYLHIPPIRFNIGISPPSKPQVTNVCIPNAVSAIDWYQYILSYEHSADSSHKHTRAGQDEINKVFVCSKWTSNM